MDIAEVNHYNKMFVYSSGSKNCQGLELVYDSNNVVTVYLGALVHLWWVYLAIQWLYLLC